MKVTYTDKVRQLPDEFHLLQQATADVEKLPEISSSNVAATWDMEGDDNRRQYVLHLTDWSGEASERFHADALRSPSWMRLSLLGLFGDIFQKRSRQQLEKLLSSGDSAEK
jgi:hypothetical protein